MAESFGGWLGRSQTIHDRIEDAALSRFRATFDCAGRDDSIPQGFHWCLGLPDAPTCALGPDGHPRNAGFLPPLALPRRMWAASEVEFLAPLTRSAEITRVSTIRNITEKSGATGPLAFIEIDHVTRSNGEVVISERQTIVYRAAAAMPLSPPPVGAPDLSAWPWQRSITPLPTLLFRFSALTFNAHRIHYDLPYATAEECYPGLVVHGPLMATLLLDLCARSLGPDALRIFNFRVVSPAFAGQPLHLVGRPGDTIELRALGADGRTVVSATAKGQK
jgi:3-methylfumaryl-CoA hydratase